MMQIASAKALRFALIIAACVAGVTSNAADVPPQIGLRYVANAGVLLTLAEGRVLIDAPIRDGIPPYATSSPRERSALERAVAPYENVDAILITHWHDDHFSAPAIAAHLASNRKTVLVSSPQVVDLVKAAAPSLDAARFRAVLPAPGASEEIRIGGLPIRVLRIRHNPSRRFPEQHVGFLVGAAHTVLHTGDADPKDDNFALLRGLPRIDTALVPYWYLLDDDGRRLVAERIAAATVVAMHLPPGEASKVSDALARANVRATVLSAPGTTVWPEPDARMR